MHYGVAVVYTGGVNIYLHVHVRLLFSEFLCVLCVFLCVEDIKSEY